LLKGAESRDPENGFVSDECALAFSREFPEAAWGVRISLGVPRLVLIPASRDSAFAQDDRSVCSVQEVEFL